MFCIFATICNMWQSTVNSEQWHSQGAKTKLFTNRFCAFRVLRLYLVHYYFFIIAEWATKTGIPINVSERKTKTNGNCCSATGSCIREHAVVSVALCAAAFFFFFDDAILMDLLDCWWLVQCHIIVAEYFRMTFLVWIWMIMMTMGLRHEK